LLATRRFLTDSAVRVVSIDPSRINMAELSM